MVDKNIMNTLKDDITEYIDTFVSCNTAFVDVPKEWVTEKFNEYGVPIVNEYGYKSDYYTRGDLQFSYDKDTDEVTEILLFPTFDDSDKGLFNGGSFINVTEDYREYAGEVLKEAKRKFNEENN